MAIALLVGIYAYGLTREINEPWVGLHDWNGAFFSQLARNFLRYPIDVHHGMPIVAAGRDVPPVDERSIYATHPPGIVWLVAGAFQVFGESEWAARLVPIVFSLATFAMLLWLIAAAYDGMTALFAGLFYAAMPMSVYYGRMVDHEAICLFCMVAASCAWVLARRRKQLSFGWWLPLVAAIWLGVWIDWSMVLFGGLFSIALIVALIRKRIDAKMALPIVFGATLAVASMVLFIVYAGLGGHFDDLFSIFRSRSGDGQYVVARSGTGDWFLHLTDNVTPGLLILALIGAVLMLAFRLTRSQSGDGVGMQTRNAARRGIHLIALAGVLWVAIFWEQFERHEYWMFYLGPAIAIAAGRGLGIVCEFARWTGARLTVIAIVAIALVTGVYEWQGLQRLFAREHRPPGEIEDYREIARLVPPGERIVMYLNPYRLERRGAYEFRNIVPPQLAWYIDRPMTVERDPAKIAALAETHAAFVIRSEEAAANREALRGIFDAFEMSILQGQVVVHLDRPKAS